MAQRAEASPPPCASQASGGTRLLASPGSEFGFREYQGYTSRRERGEREEERERDDRKEETGARREERGERGERGEREKRAWFSRQQLSAFKDCTRLLASPGAECEVRGSG